MVSFYQMEKQEMYANLAGTLAVCMNTSELAMHGQEQYYSYPRERKRRERQRERRIKRSRERVKDEDAIDRLHLKLAILNFHFWERA